MSDAIDSPKSDSPGMPVSVPTAQDVERQLLAAKDQRFQRWGLYVFLILFSSAFFSIFLYIVLSAWCSKTTDEIIAFGKLSPSATALVGAVMAAMVAVPLSLCLALSKLVSAEEEKREQDPAAFTSALFELGKAFAQGFKSLKGN